MNQILFVFVTKKPCNFFILSISITSDINLALSPICLFLSNVVCCEEIKSGRTFFSFSDRAFDIIFRSIFKKEMGLEFYMNILSLSFLCLVNDLACLHDVLKYPFSLVSNTDSTKISWTWTPYQHCHGLPVSLWMLHKRFKPYNTLMKLLNSIKIAHSLVFFDSEFQILELSHFQPMFHFCTP